MILRATIRLNKKKYIFAEARKDTVDGRLFLLGIMCQGVHFIAAPCVFLLPYIQNNLLCLVCHSLLKGNPYLVYLMLKLVSC